MPSGLNHAPTICRTAAKQAAGQTAAESLEELQGERKHNVEVKALDAGRHF